MTTVRWDHRWKGFMPPFRAAGHQGAEDEHMGSDEEEDITLLLRMTETQGAAVHAGQFQQWEAVLWHGKICHPALSQQQAAHPRPHDGHIVKRLTNGHGAVIGHHGEEEDATPPKKCSAKSWAMQPSREMVVLSERESTINLGAMMEEKVASKRDKEVRKKYLGDLRLWLITMVITMRRFPKTVANTWLETWQRVFSAALDTSWCPKEWIMSHCFDFPCVSCWYEFQLRVRRPEKAAHGL